MKHDADSLGDVVAGQHWDANAQVHFELPSRTRRLSEAAREREKGVPPLKGERLLKDTVHAVFEFQGRPSDDAAPGVVLGSALRLRPRFPFLEGNRRCTQRYSVS